MPIAAYGSWESPVSVEQLTSAAVGLGSPTLDGAHLYWLQSHADQGGRVSLWRRTVAGGEPEEITPAPINVRDQVHEYGGGEYDVRDGVVVFSDLRDGRLHRWRDGEIAALTPDGDFRYADVRVHPERGLVLAVREDHTGPGEAVNTIVALDLEGAEPTPAQVLCSGADFYSTPELSATGQLAWTEWNHPNLPWDSTTVRVATLAGADLADVRVVAGGPGESAIQPRWLGERLLLVSDRTDWWNLYAWDGPELTALCPTDAEFAGPQWVLGDTPYAVLDDGQLLCTLNRSGAQTVALLDPQTGGLTSVTEPGVSAAGVSVAGRTAAAVLSFPDRPDALSLLDLDTLVWTELLASTDVRLEPGAVSRAEAVSWPSAQGEVHGWFYPPTNAGWSAPEDERPPLITLSHGGPTSFASPGFRLAYQFWTTRGFAILDVNYGGSTGYGRAYRDRLTDRWGLVDVADCVAGAAAMGERGRADPARLAVKGGSAGGYTTLRALTSTTGFAAGISQYGVGDLEALATDTHKFESRYLDGLIGPYPEARDVYRDRSPLHHVDALAAPILLLQGLDDRVVPPNQAETMAAAARAKGLPVALLMFAGEGHGFRRSETIMASLNAQLDFLGRIFGFTPAGDVPPIEIDNLDSRAQRGP